MNDVSARLLLNIAYEHLAAPLRHVEECAERCAEGCGHRVLEEWLSSPATRSDIEADERREQRLQALLRGEIPT
jgi:hypothetical protein